MKSQALKNAQQAFIAHENWVGFTGGTITTYPRKFSCFSTKYRRSQINTLIAHAFS